LCLTQRTSTRYAVPGSGMTEIAELRLMKRLGYVQPLEVRLIELLSVDNAIPIRRLAELTDTTDKTVIAAVNRLEQSGILRRTRKGNHGRVPMSYEIEDLEMTG
jgi:DNA-binding MarR family transcriptional regulator